LTAVAPGGTVHVAAGDYPENLIIRKPMILDGAGSETTRLLADMAGRGIQVIASDVEIHGLAVVGTGAPSPGGGLVAGIWAENAAGLTLRDSAIGPYCGLGIAVGYGTGALIENNVVSQVRDHPDYPDDATGVLLHMVSGVLRNNISTGNVNGIYVSGDRGQEFALSVVGNRIEQNDYWGLNLNNAHRIADLLDNAILNNGGPGVIILDELAYYACQLGGGENCEPPTTEIDNCGNNTQSGNNPDTLGGCFGGGGYLDAPCEDDDDCLDPLVCESGYSATCKLPLGAWCYGDPECVHPYTCCHGEYPSVCGDPLDPLCEYLPE
jgi:hypothetical protein